MATRIKIRGIYSTALTKLALDWGYSVVDSSGKIRERFSLMPNEGPWDILVQDRDDLQGVDLDGEPEKLCQFLTFLQERLPDIILMRLAPLDEQEGLVRARTEFPGGTKDILDNLRLFVAPTVPRHHRLRIINAEKVERAEEEISKYPEKIGEMGEKLFEDCIQSPMQKSGVVRLEHIRPSGKAMRPREGKIVESGKQRVLFKRSFAGGRYDGLDVPIQPGDYGLTEIVDGSWVVKHAYFTREGQLVGEYYNINTPVELYPHGARYVDLEVDVIRRAGEEPFLIDREKLGLLQKQGCISELLEARALSVAEELLRRWKH